MSVEFDQIEIDGHDYHIRQENGAVYVDAFDSTIANNDDAHVGTDSFESRDDALGFIANDGFRTGKRGTNV